MEEIKDLGSNLDKSSLDWMSGAFAIKLVVGEVEKSGREERISQREWSTRLEDAKFREWRVENRRNEENVEEKLEKLKKTRYLERKNWVIEKVQKTWRCLVIRVESCSK